MPRDRGFLNSVYRFMQRGIRGREGKPDEVAAGSSESASGDGGDSCFFEQDTANFLSRHAGAVDVDPGVERAIRMRAAEAGNLIQFFGQYAR